MNNKSNLLMSLEIDIESFILILYFDNLISLSLELDEKNLSELLILLILTIFSFFQIVNDFFHTVASLMSMGILSKISNSFLKIIINLVLVKTFSRIYNSLYDSFIQLKFKIFPEFFIALFLDAIHIKLKVNSSIKSILVYFIIGILPSGDKKVLDFIIDLEPENSSKYLEVLSNIKNR